MTGSMTDRTKEALAEALRRINEEAQEWDRPHIEANPTRALASFCNIKYAAREALAAYSSEQGEGKRMTNGELRNILKAEAEKRGINMIQLGLSDRGEEAVIAAMDRVATPPPQPTTDKSER